MNLFLSLVMFSVKKVSFPAKTAVYSYIATKHTDTHYTCKYIYTTHTTYLHVKSQDKYLPR